MKSDVSAGSFLAVVIVGLVGWIVARFAAGLFRAGAGDHSREGPSIGWGSAGDDMHHDGSWGDGGHAGDAGDGGGDGGAGH